MAQSNETGNHNKLHTGCSLWLCVVLTRIINCVGADIPQAPTYAHAHIEHVTHVELISLFYTYVGEVNNKVRLTPELCFLVAIRDRTR